MEHVFKNTRWHKEKQQLLNVIANEKLEFPRPDHLSWKYNQQLENVKLLHMNEHITEDRRKSQLKILHSRVNKNVQKCLLASS